MKPNALKRIAVVDFETTGLPLHPAAPVALQPRITEAGCVMVNSRGEVEGEFTQLYNPERPLDADVKRITGLTDEQLREQPLFADGWRALCDWLERADAFLAHNVGFDAGVLFHELQRVGASAWSAAPPLMCTVELYTPMFGHRPKLIHLYADVFGVPLRQTHRALDDARALADIVCEEQLWRFIPPRAATHASFNQATYLEPTDE